MVVVTVQLTSVGLLQDGLVDVLRDERVVWARLSVEHGMAEGLRTKEGVRVPLGPPMNLILLRVVSFMKGVRIFQKAENTRGGLTANAMPNRCEVNQAEERKVSDDRSLHAAH